MKRHDGERVLDNPWAHDPIHAAAWVGCLRWALGHEPTLAAYRADTGDSYAPARTPIDVMIDRATGRDFEFIKSFAEWVTANIYGAPECGACCEEP